MARPGERCKAFYRTHSLFRGKILGLHTTRLILVKGGSGLLAKRQRNGLLILLQLIQERKKELMSHSGTSILCRNGVISMVHGTEERVCDSFSQ